MSVLLMVSAMFMTVPQVQESHIDHLSVSFSMRGDTLVKIIEFRGIQGHDRRLSRISANFDPACQSISLETAEYGNPGSEMREVPSWAVDTLTGERSWERSLVTVFPSLMAGMEVHYRVHVEDFSGNRENGFWALLSPRFAGIRADTFVVRIPQGLFRDLFWQGRGYDLSSSHGCVSLSASDSSGTLRISPFADPSELEGYLLSQADSILEGTYPSDLREAALQVTSAGSDIWAQSMRLRSLLCNSIQPLQDRDGTGEAVCRDLQTILDTRKATPLEMAVLYAAICRELGIEATPAIAGEDAAAPVPGQWDRFLVKVTSSEGDSWFVEPSAFLTEADWIYLPDTLYACCHGDMYTLMPNDSRDNRCSQQWEIDPSLGRFRVLIHCTGWYDMILRRRTTDSSPQELTLSMSEWAWQSGRYVIPDSMTVSDPFDLTCPMTLSMTGRLWESTDDSLLAERLPVLLWNRPDSVRGRMETRWTLSDWMVSSYPPGILHDMDAPSILEDTSKTDECPFVLMEPSVE